MYELTPPVSYCCNDDQRAMCMQAKLCVGGEKALNRKFQHLTQASPVRSRVPFLFCAPLPCLGPSLDKQYGGIYSPYFRAGSLLAWLLHRPCAVVVAVCFRCRVFTSGPNLARVRPLRQWTRSMAPLTAPSLLRPEEACPRRYVGRFWRCC